jgi:hypothetical protein
MLISSASSSSSSYHVNEGMAFNVIWTEYHFLLALASICFNPIFWNVVARLEYKTHFLTKLWGSPYRGCYFLAVVIFSLGLIRDRLYIFQCFTSSNFSNFRN